MQFPLFARLIFLWRNCQYGSLVADPSSPDFRSLPKIRTVSKIIKQPAGTIGVDVISALNLDRHLFAEYGRGTILMHSSKTSYCYIHRSIDHLVRQKLAPHGRNFARKRYFLVNTQIGKISFLLR